PAAPRTPGRHQPITAAGRPRTSRLATQPPRRSTPPGVTPTRPRPPRGLKTARRRPDARRGPAAPRREPEEQAQQREASGRIAQVRPTRGRELRERGGDASESERV